MISFRFVHRTIREEAGTVSVWWVMTAMLILSIGGFAIDHSRVMAEQVRLQVAADASAHAAAWALVDFDPDGDVAAQLAAAKAAGLRYAADNLGDGRPSSILAPDIEFGKWNQAARSFTATPSGFGDAVRVTSYRTTSRSDALPTTYLGLVGLDSFDVRMQSIFQLKLQPCQEDGIAACGKVDLSSGNKFDEGYCVHGNTGVELQNGNIFANGTIVSTPRKAMLNASFESNPGLEEAFRQATYCPREVKAIPNVIETFKNCEAALVKDWCSGTSVDLSGNRDDFEPSMIVPNAYHWVGCKNKQLFFSGGTYQNAIIHTDCAVQFRAGVILENVVVISDSTDKAAFGSPNGGSGIQIGKDDDCKPGGGAMLITPGGMSFASGINLSGSQLIAGKNVEFSAQGSGVNGGQISAGGDVISTSNIHFGPCGYDADTVGTLYPVMRQ